MLFSHGLLFITVLESHVTNKMEENLASSTSRAALIGVVNWVFPFSVGQCHCLCQKTVVTVWQAGKDEMSVRYRAKAEQPGDAFLTRLAELWDLPPLLRSSSHAHPTFFWFCLRKPSLSKKITYTYYVHHI